MSTPKDLLHELKVLAKHYRAAAARKRALVRELSGGLRGIWTSTDLINLVVGKAYFFRSALNSGGHSLPCVQRFERRGVRGVWVLLYGTDLSLSSDHRHSEVLVPPSPAPASSRRRSQGSKA